MNKDTNRAPGELHAFLERHPDTQLLELLQPDMLGILRGKRVGLSLADIKQLLDLYDVGDGRETQRVKTIELCQAQVDRLERQRVDIDATLDELHEFIALLEGGKKD